MNNEDFEQLAISFAAKKQMEEAEQRISVLSSFINKLRSNPKFWGKSYRKEIEKFCQEEKIPDS